MFPFVGHENVRIGAPQPLIAKRNVELLDQFPGPQILILF
jgi:hypothetical protein